MEMTQKAMIDRLFGRSGSGQARSVIELPRQSVVHDSVDKMQFDVYSMGSPRFHRLTAEEKPQIAPDVPDPDPIDFTTASADEIKEWQAKAKAAKEARENAPLYELWEYLTRDSFYGYHHPSEPVVLDPAQMDPSVSLHSKIMSLLTATDDWAQTRNITRDDAVTTACAVMAMIRRLRSTLEDQLIEQARDSESFEQARDEAEGAMQALDDLRAQAQELHDQGQPIPGDLVEDIKQAVQNKRQAQAKAADIAMNTPKPMDKAAYDAVLDAAKAGREAAEAVANMPSFNQGLGEGEPRYDSPEQALSIADMWANNEILKAVADLYGRLKPDTTSRRAKRVQGGADEIVDLTQGDEIRRVLPSELGALADPDLEDDFYVRYMGAELRVYDTVGEEQAGKGPIVLSCDESYSMEGDRNIWTKAMAMVLLNIARREKRDFCYIGWSSGTQVYSVLFKAREALDANAVIEMASHFFGGGTTPIIGLALADKIMHDVAEFRKADIVMITDGEAGFGDEDKRLRDRLDQKGVRIWGIGIGDDVRRDGGYLNKLTDDVVNMHDFELSDPSEATAHLATHIT